MTVMNPKISYTIWFTQRTGSTLLCKALENTGLAGKPEELPHLKKPAEFLEHYEVNNYHALKENIWEKYSTDNGVLGTKISYYEPYISTLLDTFNKFTSNKTDSFNKNISYSRPDIWENAFPNCKHIFMTRRNKIRLAVSWWKAIQTDTWHRKKSKGKVKNNISGVKQEQLVFDDKYNYEAINQLLFESIFREAGIQEFLAERNIVPLTITYEDFINNYEGTVKNILDYLNIETENVNISPPFYEKLADDISEKWVQKFREESQEEWDNKGW